MILATGRIERSVTSGFVPPIGHPDLVGQVHPSAYFLWKESLARTAAALLLIPGAMMLPFLMLLVRLTSKGPAIYRQKRVGKHGTTFMMYKLRTMRHDAEAVTGPVWTSDDDSRITPVGKLLRRLHLDELPQLLNVLRGEMDLVGPRPERPTFAAVLAEQIPGYRQRLAVRPGITGLAQVNQGPDESLDSVRRKLAFDLEYIETASLGLDLRVLFCTSLKLVGLRGCVALHWLGLNRVSAARHKPIGSHGSIVTPEILAQGAWGRGC